LYQEHMRCQGVSTKNRVKWNSVLLFQNLMYFTNWQVQIFSDLTVKLQQNIEIRV
jgi:hypothetical protein